MQPDPTTQATTETAAPPAAPAASSAPATPAERPQLASFGDALNTAAERKSADASNGGTDAGKPTVSDAKSTPAPAVKPDASTSSPNADPRPEPTATGDSADEASKPDQDGKEQPGKPDGAPSRRERAEIRDLTTERDALRAKVADLEARTAIPEHITQAAVKSRLSDDEFNALRTRRERESLTGDYLSADENDKLDRALQVRDWSQAWYADAEQRAAAYAESQRTAVMQNAAEQLAPVLRARPYIGHESISSAVTWTAVYDHIADSSLAEGRRLEREALQPKLDEATGRIHDLEAELSGLRHRPSGDGMAFDRGGTSSGAYKGRPDFKTASASDLFTAAAEEAERARSRRRAS